MKETELATVGPTLFVMIGVPGAGRTYTARRLAESVSGFHLQSDEFRSELFDIPERSSQQDNVVNRVSLLMLEKLLPLKINIVIDGDNNKRSVRQHLRSLARKNGYEIVTVWIQTDVDTAFTRASKRDRRGSEDKYAIEYGNENFDKELDDFQSPQYENYVVVSGKHLYKTQYYAIRKKLAELELLKREGVSRLKAMSVSKPKPKTARNVHPRRRLSL